MIDIRILRQSLIAELEAINLYEELLEEAKDEKAKELLRFLIKEEKEHVAKIFKLLLELDKEQEEWFRK